MLYEVITVLYDWQGFMAPVNNLPTVNTAKAGQTIPVKWQIPTPDGGYIRDTGIVSAIQVAPTACDAEGTVYEDAIDADATGGIGLRYDIASEQFVYNWETVITSYSIHYTKLYEGRYSSDCGPRASDSSYRCWTKGPAWHVITSYSIHYTKLYEAQTGKKHSTSAVL